MGTTRHGLIEADQSCFTGQIAVRMWGGMGAGIRRADQASQARFLGWAGGADLLAQSSSSRMDCLDQGGLIRDEGRGGPPMEYKCLSRLSHRCPTHVTGRDARSTG